MILAIFTARETCIKYSKNLAKDHRGEDKCEAMTKLHCSMMKKVMKSIIKLYHKGMYQSNSNVFLQQCNVDMTFKFRILSAEL